MKQNSLALSNVLLSLLLLVSPLSGTSGDSPSYLRSPSNVLERSLRNEENCTAECCALAFPTTDDFETDCSLCNSRALEDAVDEEPGGIFDALDDWMKIILIIFLICFSATFSGLTLGLMGLDKTGLEIVMDSEDPVNKRLAAKIYPLRKDGNLLLCTLLLGNTAVNALLSILMADFTGGLLGFLASTFLILIFGEITPQAICSRYALQIGSRVVPLVQLIVVLLYPLTKPLAWTLDKALGKELATTYSGAELLKLLQIHVEENAMDPDTANTMGGALRYKDLSVHEVMTPLENVFMLSVEDKLNFETIAKIFKTGYSRIPVYEVSRNNVIGLLMVKDLIFVDPEDETRIRDFIEIMGRSFHICWPDDKLGEILRALKRGKSHMAIVQDVNNDDSDADPFYEIKGIITLEDIIEEILGDEIVDETDAFLDGTHSVKLDRADAFEFARLRLLHNKIVDQTLSLDETRAVTAHLTKNYPQVVAMLSESQLFRLVSETPVSDLPTAPHAVGQDLPSELLYEKGVQNDMCTLILSGKVTVLVGEDGFRSDVSSWSLLGAKALDDSSYSPDFTAFVSSGPCRCIRFSRTRYIAAQDTSTVQKIIQPPAPAVDNSLDKSEATRKAKLMAAMRAVDGGSASGGSTKHILTTASNGGVDVVEDKPSASERSATSNGKS